MPNYDYVCADCGHKEEILQKITDSPLVECPVCHHSAFKRKMGQGIGLQFQGSGFYSTDYPTQKSPANAKPDTSSGSNCGCGQSACPK